MAHKLLIAVVLIILAILFLVSIIGYPTKEGEPARLGIIGRKTLPCTGKLSVTSRPIEDGKCELQTDVTMNNCEGEKWYVFEGDSCSGTYMCNGDINEAKSIWKCSWEADKGTYTFTLCADFDAKATRTAVC